MTLKKGVTLYHGKEKFTGEIPDEKAKEFGLKPEGKKSAKVSAPVDESAEGKAR